MIKHTLRGNCHTWEVYLDGKPLDPKESQKVVNHSPDGFCWGYSGSGPSQLALAVVIAISNNTFHKGGKLPDYHKFKEEVIAKLPQEDFDIVFWYQEAFYGFEHQ